MQSKDTASNEFFEDPRRFADLLNVDLFGGRPVIKPSDIQERNRRSRKRNRQRGKGSQSIERDVRSQVSLGVKLFLVSLENQSDIHYAMPLRVMNGESAGYDTQWRKISKKHKEEKDLRGAEYLSGMAKEDRLLPLLTIVLYYGEKPWDGPRSLKDMLDLAEYPEEVKKLIADYPMHLIEIRNYPNPERFQTDLRFVFEFLQNSDSGEKLEAYVTSHQKELSELADDTYDLINAMANTEALTEIMEKNQNESGGKDMCKGLDEYGEKREQQGVKIGKEIGEKIGKEIGEKMGKEIGEKIGEINGKKRIAKNMHHDGKSPEYIARMTEETVDTIQEWIQESAS